MIAGMTDEDSASDEPPIDKEPPPVIDAATIFGERREVCLELDGVRYRLRITRKGKLILQK